MEMEEQRLCVAWLSVDYFNVCVFSADVCAAFLCIYNACVCECACI